MNSLVSLRHRVRLTCHMPLDGTWIGPTVWLGSVEGGWRGWPLFKRGISYSITGQS